MRQRCRWSASRHIAVQGSFSAMRNEHSGKNTPRPPVCPSCAQIMRLARTTLRFGSLADLFIFLMSSLWRATKSSPEKRALYLKMASVWHQMAQRWEKKSQPSP